MSGLAVSNGRKRKAGEPELQGPVKARKRNAAGNVSAPLPQISLSTDRGKPKPIGHPKVWAVRRQALIESLPYYSSMEGAWSVKGEVAKGLLLAVDDSPRIYGDGDVFITRATGGKSKDSTGVVSTIQDTSHREDHYHIRAIKAACEQRASVVLLATKSSNLMQVEMPENFNVLDQYQITHFWWEKAQTGSSKAVDVFKYRFERIELSVQPWFAPEGNIHKQPDYTAVCCQLKCGTCNKDSIQVYSQWMCLHKDCLRFWHLVNGSSPSNSTLQFNPAFISLRTPWSGKYTYDLVPKVFSPTSTQDLIKQYSRDIWKGFYCTRCGRCNSRESFHSFECPCGLSYELPPLILTPKDANIDVSESDASYNASKSSKKSIMHKSIKKLTTKLGNWELDTYKIFEGNFVIHYRASDKVNRAVNGADDLFKAAQGSRTSGLRRNLMGHATAETSTGKLTRHFSRNYGVPYKFTGGADHSVAFRDADPVILYSMKLLQGAATHAGIDATKMLNELLEVSYMAEGAMHYHDDGEPGLGPTVCSLSLGSDAAMKFKVKQSHHDIPLKINARTKKETYQAEMWVPLDCPLHQQRLEMQGWISGNPNATEEQVVAKFKSLPKVEKFLKDKKPSNSLMFLQVILKHGDIIVMHGPDLQEHIVHQVEPLGCLRFAMTGRYIDPSKFTAQQQQQAAFDFSTFPEAHSASGSTTF